MGKVYIMAKDLSTNKTEILAVLQNENEAAKICKKLNERRSNIENNVYVFGFTHSPNTWEGQ